MDTHPSQSLASPSRDWGGLGLVTLSAAGFATLAIFGKLALAAGMTLPTMLALRFSGAALLFGALLLSRREAGGLRLGRGVIGRLLLMGGIGYAVQSALFLGAVAFIPAAVTGMLLYTYPAWVTLLAWRLDGDRPDRRRWTALALALAGTTLIAGSPDGQLHPLGLALALASGVWYSGYIVLGNRVVAGVPPLVGSAWVAVGAMTSFTVVGLLLGQIRFTFTQPDGTLAMLGMVLLATVIPIVAFLAGLQRLGPARTAILSTFEPVCTVVLAVALLGERLTPTQAIGSGLVLLAVTLLQTRR
ncbi:MAG: EamA family transporter [Anaerolineae bacterium]|nr:EamA family transporter [Anaerolineae bacterium]